MEETNRNLHIPTHEGGHRTAQSIGFYTQKRSTLLSTTKKKTKILRSTLARPTGSNQRNISSRLDLKRQIAENTDTRSGRVSEVNVLKPNVTLHRLLVDDLALRRFRVDLRRRVQQLDDIRPGTLRRGDIGDEREHVSGLDGSECRALFIKKKVKVR